jgi:hypothetical protein
MDGWAATRPGMEVALFGSILQRMILWELTKVFAMSLLGITGILLMAGIIAEASQQGLGPTQILAAIPLLVPSTLPYTIPATTLFATCVVYGRLAADNEILAIKSAGINAIKVVHPGILLGVVMSVATMALYYRIIPYTHHLLRAMVFNDAEELLYSLLRKHNEIRHSSFPYQVFVKGVKGKTLLDPIFKRKDAHGGIDWVAHAREAELQVLPSKGQVKIHMKHCVMWGENETTGTLLDKVLAVELPKDFGKQSQRRPRDLTWQEILDKRIELQEHIEEIQKRIAIAATKQVLADAPVTLHKFVKSSDERLHHLFFADCVCVLSAHAVRNRHGQGGTLQHDPSGLGCGRDRRRNGIASILEAAEELNRQGAKDAKTREEARKEQLPP